MIRTHRLQLALQRRGYPVRITPYQGQTDVAHLRLWRRRRWAWYIADVHKPYTLGWLQGALCVHAGEGAWTDDTGNGFYGGLQFDSGSWLANGGGRYAPTANLAPPWAQLVTAYRYWRVSGWAPWPNTARACGLL